MRQAIISTIIFIFCNVKGMAMDLIDPGCKEKTPLPSRQVTLEQALFLDEQGYRIPLLEPIPYLATERQQDLMVLTLFNFKRSETNQDGKKNDTLNSQQPLGGMACFDKKSPSLSILGLFYLQVRDLATNMEVRAKLYYPSSDSGKEIILSFLKEKKVNTIEIYNTIQDADNILCLEMSTGELFSTQISGALSSEAHKRSLLKETGFHGCTLF